MNELSKLANIRNTIKKIKENIKNINSSLKMNLDGDSRTTLYRLKEKLNSELEGLINKEKAMKIQSIKNSCQSCLDDLKNLDTKI